MLDQDKAEVTMNAIVHLSMQMNNSAVGPFTPTSFETTPGAIAVNGLLYASLGVTLVSAMVAMLVKLWTREFDRGLRSMTDPKERAGEREKRFNALQRWHLHEIASSLPLILLVALMLFFAGLVTYTWLIERRIGIILLVIVSVGPAFYAVTTCIAIWHAYSPFPSPLSRLIILILNGIFRKNDPTTGAPKAPYLPIVKTPPPHMGRSYYSGDDDVLYRLIDTTSITPFNIPRMKAVMETLSSEHESRVFELWIFADRKSVLWKMFHQIDVDGSMALLAKYIADWDDGHGTTLLCHASAKGWVKDAQALLNHGAAIKGSTSSPFRSPLYYAAASQHKEVVTLLLEKDSHTEEIKVCLPYTSLNGLLTSKNLVALQRVCVVLPLLTILTGSI
jgi:Family of unknown function (DUF6535)